MKTIRITPLKEEAERILRELKSYEVGSQILYGEMLYKIQVKDEDFDLAKNIYEMRIRK